MAGVKKRRLRVGDQVTVVSQILGEDGAPPSKKPLRMSGTVMYIHPNGRYFVAEFVFSAFGQTNRVREGFLTGGGKIG